MSAAPTVMPSSLTIPLWVQKRRIFQGGAFFWYVMIVVAGSAPGGLDLGFDIIEAVAELHGLDPREAHLLGDDLPGGFSAARSAVTDSVLGTMPDVGKVRNSWAEYASAVPIRERAFVLAGVGGREREKRELVGRLVDTFLATRAAGMHTEGTVRVDELTINTVLDPVDVRWWSWSPVRELFVVTAIEPAENGMLAITTETMYGAERTRVVRRDRRFLKARTD